MTDTQFGNDWHLERSAWLDALREERQVVEKCGLREAISRALPRAFSVGPHNREESNLQRRIVYQKNRSTNAG